MPDLSVQIARILSTGSLRNLLGIGENEEFEAKSEPYDLDSPVGRYELAKDISAFANAKGGHLIIGLETKREKTRDSDVVSSINWLTENSFSIDQYKGVMKEYIYPEIKELNVDYMREGESDKGLLVISLPLQHPDAGPFLIKRIIDEGQEVRQIVVGFAQRKGAHNSVLTYHELQERFRKGSNTVSIRLSRIEEKLDAVLDKAVEPSSETLPDVEQRKRRIADILEIDS